MNVSSATSTTSTESPLPASKRRKTRSSAKAKEILTEQKTVAKKDDKTRKTAKLDPKNSEAAVQEVAKNAGVKKPKSSDEYGVYPVSRSKIEMYVNCSRCFYLDWRHGIKRPPGYPFTLNCAVDELLKKEFDICREKQEPHPYMTQLLEEIGEAVPFKDEKMKDWRFNFKGIRHVHKTGFEVFGAVDDIWITKDGTLIVVDYKATAKNGEINLNADWQESYKRQMEVYIWLLRQNGYKVSNTAIFVYCNGDKSLPAFNEKLEFKIHLIPYEADDSWIPKTLQDMKECLDKEKPPKASHDCKHCEYAEKNKEIPA